MLFSPSLPAMYTLEVMLKMKILRTLLYLIQEGDGISVLGGKFL